MDSELLAQMLEEISAKNTRIHSVLVAPKGYLVTEAYFHPYDRETKMHVQSVTKSVIGVLDGKKLDSTSRFSLSYILNCQYNHTNIVFNETGDTSWKTFA